MPLQDQKPTVPIGLVEITSQTESLRGHLIRGITGVGAFKLTALALSMVVSIITARALGPKGYGQVAFVISMINLLILPVSGGLAPLLVRELAKYNHLKGWEFIYGILHRTRQWVTATTLLLGVPLGIWFISQAKWLPDDRFTLLSVGLISMPILAWSALRTAALQGLGRVVLAQFADWVLSPATQLGIVAILLVIGAMNPLTVLGAHVAALSVAFMFSTIALKRSLPGNMISSNYRFEDRIWLHAWWPFALLNAVNVANMQVSLALLGLLGSDTQVGLYRVAENGAIVVSLSLTVVNAVIAPHISRLYHVGDMERLERIAQTSARAALALAVPIAVILFLAGRPILNAIFGAAYQAAYPALAILLLGQIVNVSCGSVVLLMNMSGHERDSLMALILALSLNITIAVVLIPNFGEIGAAVASSGAMIVWNIWLLIRVNKRLGIRCAVI